MIPDARSLAAAQVLLQYAKALAAAPVKRISSRGLKLQLRTLAMPLKELEIGVWNSGFSFFAPLAIPASRTGISAVPL